MIREIVWVPPAPGMIASFVSVRPILAVEDAILAFFSLIFLSFGREIPHVSTECKFQSPAKGKAIDGGNSRNGKVIKISHHSAESGDEWAYFFGGHASAFFQIGTGAKCFGGGASHDDSAEFLVELDI